MDFFNDGVIVTEETPLGIFSQKKGLNTLTVKITGANEKSNPKRYMFGLDYLLIVPVKETS
ncbi:MAG: hypothetical protein RBT84_18635, partial [FCB group bacterium]|jgi:hypothetical protein|nr:hypothetical protein [FCB group bacterium]